MTVKCLIKTSLSLVDGTVILVRAADLYDFLCIKCDFQDWFKDIVEKFHLLEGNDYLAIESRLRPCTFFDWVLPLHVAEKIIGVDEANRETHEGYVHHDHHTLRAVEITR